MEIVELLKTTLYSILSEISMKKIIKSNLIALARCSTEDQDYEQQVDIINKFVNEWTEDCHLKLHTIKESGVGDDRILYEKFLDDVKWTNKPVVLCSKWYQLGHDNVAKLELFCLIKRLGGRLISIDPFMDSDDDNCNLLFAISSHCESDWYKNWKAAQQRGVDKAKAKGNYKGGKVGRRMPWVPSDAKIIKTYHQLKSMNTTAKVLGTSRATVARRLKLNGITIERKSANILGINQYSRKTKLIS